MTDEELNPHVSRKLVTDRNRLRSGQNRIYQHLGVRDLREIIDRKRNERGYHDETAAPPPDQSYHYLKDPLREDTKQNTQDLEQHNFQKYKNKSNSFKKDKEQFTGHTSHTQKMKDIENPKNIKVEFSTSTGEHVYKLDESTTLPTIKHIPDHAILYRRTFRGRGRGRGRGRILGSQRFQTRTIRNNKRLNNNQSLQSNSEGIVHTPISGENWDDIPDETLEVIKQDDEGTQEYKEFDNDCDHGDVDDDEKCVIEGLEKDIENLKLNEGKGENSKCDRNKNAEKV